MTRGNKRAVAKSVTLPSGWPPAGAGPRGAAEDRFEERLKIHDIVLGGSTRHCDVEVIRRLKISRPEESGNAGGGPECKSFISCAPTSALHP